MEVRLSKEDNGDRVVALLVDAKDFVVKEGGAWKVPGELSAPLYGGFEGFSTVPEGSEADKLRSEAVAFFRSLPKRDNASS